MEKEIEKVKKEKLDMTQLCNVTLVDLQSMSIDKIKEIRIDLSEESETIKKFYSACEIYGREKNAILRHCNTTASNAEIVWASDIWQKLFYIQTRKADFKNKIKLDTVLEVVANQSFWDIQKIVKSQGIRSPKGNLHFEQVVDVKALTKAQGDAVVKMEMTHSNDGRSSTKIYMADKQKALDMLIKLMKFDHLRDLDELDEDEENVVRRINKQNVEQTARAKEIAQEKQEQSKY